MLNEWTSASHLENSEGKRLAWAARDGRMRREGEKWLQSALPLFVMANFLCVAEIEVSGWNLSYPGSLLYKGNIVVKAMGVGEKGIWWWWWWCMCVSARKSATCIKELCIMESAGDFLIIHKCILWKSQHLDLTIIRGRGMIACLAYPIVSCGVICFSLIHSSLEVPWGHPEYRGGREARRKDADDTSSPLPCTKGLDLGQAEL